MDIEEPGASVYEFAVADQLGPVVRSCFPDFRIDTAAPSSVLMGTSAGPEELRSLLDRLDACGCTPVAIRLIDQHL